MAGFGTWLKGAVAQINPFDNGANFQSVMQDDERKRREQEAQRQRAAQQQQQIQKMQQQAQARSAGAPMVLNQQGTQDWMKKNAPQPPKPATPQITPPASINQSPQGIASNPMEQYQAKMEQQKQKMQAQAQANAQKQTADFNAQNQDLKRRIEPVVSQGLGYDDIAKRTGTSHDQVKQYMERNHKGYGDQGIINNALRAGGNFLRDTGNAAAGIVTKPFNEAVETPEVVGNRLVSINEDYRAGRITPEAAMERVQKEADRRLAVGAQYDKENDQFGFKKFNALEFGGQFAQQGVDTASVLPVGGGVASGVSKFTTGATKTGLEKVANVLSAGAQTQSSSRLADALAKRGINQGTANIVGNAITSNAKQSAVYGTAQTAADVASGRGITPESLALNYGADFAMGALPEVALGTAGRSMTYTAPHNNLMKTSPEYRATFEQAQATPSKLERAALERRMETMRTRQSEGGFIGGEFGDALRRVPMNIRNGIDSMTSRIDDFGGNITNGMSSLGRGAGDVVSDIGSRFGEKVLDARIAAQNIDLENIGDAIRNSPNAASEMLDDMRVSTREAIDNVRNPVDENYRSPYDPYDPYVNDPLPHEGYKLTADEPDYRLGAPGESISRADMQRIQLENNRMFGADSPNVEFRNGVILTKDGRTALGATTDNPMGHSKLELAKQQGDPQATFHHEAVHKALNDYMDDGERRVVLESYASDKGIANTTQSKEEFFHGIEEKMSEDFIQYVAAKNNPNIPTPTISERVKEIFDRVMDRLQSVFRQADERGTLPPEYKQFYDDLYGGRYANEQVIDKVSRNAPAEQAALMEHRSMLQHQFDTTSDPTARAGINQALQDVDSQIGSFKKKNASDTRYFVAGDHARGWEDAKKAGRVFEGVDGKSRFEVSDEGARLNNEQFGWGLKLDEKPRKLSEVLQHDSLYQQYPELKDIEVRFEPNDIKGQDAHFDPNTNSIVITKSRADESHLSDILHEIQHSIQEREGFARGGAPDGNLIHELADYRRLAGEAEARAVSARRNMTDAERYVKGQQYYHGSPKAEAIKREGFKLKEPNLTRAFGDGIYITTNKNEAKGYATTKDGGVVYAHVPDNLRLFKATDADAYNIDTQRLKDEGYDGVELRGGAMKTVVVFDPTKIEIGKPKDRSTFYDSLDVPKDDLIVRQGNGGKAMSVDNGSPKMTRELKNAINDVIYEQDPSMVEKLSMGADMRRSLNEGGETNALPKVHVDDLKHYLGYQSETIPSFYKRRSGERDIDLLAARAGYDNIDDFMEEYVNQIEAKAMDKESIAKIRELRKDPEIIAKAQERIDAKRAESRVDVEDSLRQRETALKANNLEEVKDIEDYIRAVEKEAGLSPTKFAKKRDADAKTPREKMSEYVAASFINDAGKPETQLIPLDRTKHTLKNGTVVDKSGKNVGSYVGIDKRGQQYAFLEGKPVNITGILGDIDAWGNMNDVTMDMDRLIEANAPNKDVARRVQKFTTAFKDSQESQMKTELLQRRTELAEMEHKLVSNLPKGVSKQQLTQDMFRIMEKKTTLNEINERYGKDYVQNYIKPAIEKQRAEFDAILKEVNHTLVSNGFDEIPKRDNYITHIQKDPKFWEKFGIGIQDLTNLGKGINSDINPGNTRGAIPEEIVGNTANTAARRKWNPFAQTRRGSSHEQDFFKAIDSYYEPMLFNKYMTPAASRSRIVERTFRTFEKAKEIRAEQLLEVADASTAKDMAGLNNPRNHKKYDPTNSSPFILAWQEYGNKLAGKTNKWDRSVLESSLGQKMQGKKLLDASVKLQGVTGANTIPGSATAALAQTLSLPQTIARDSLPSVAKGIGDTIQWMTGKKLGKDGRLDPMMQSSFMRARYTDASSKRKSAMRKYTDFASKPMEMIERTTGEISWRSAYNEALRKGLKGSAAVREADIETKKTLAGRGIGDRPLAMDSKALGALTQFGLEVNNMRIQFWRDFSPVQKTKFIVAAFALNQAYEMATGNAQLPDYLDAAIDSGAGFATMNDDKDNDGKADSNIGNEIWKTTQRFGGETAKFIPGAGVIANNALSGDVAESLFGKDSDVSRYGDMAFTKVPKALVQVANGVLSGDMSKVGDAILQTLPTGQQVRRSLGGIETMKEGVAKTNSGNLVTPVNSEDIGKWIQATVFGKNALSEVKSAYESNQSASVATNKEQTEIYNDIKTNSGISAANDYLRSIKGSGGDKESIKETTGSADVSKIEAEARLKVKKGTWKEENGLLVNKNGDVQRDYYKSIAKTLSDSGDTSDKVYDYYMKGYNIDGASNRMRAAKNAGVLGELESTKDKVNKADTAVKMLTSESYDKMPDWVKNKYFEDAGFSKKDVEYGAQSSYTSTQKLDGHFRAFAQNNEHDALIDELYRGRKQGITGKKFADDSVINKLRDEGYISKDEAKYLRDLTVGKDGTETSKASSSGGKKGKSGASASILTSAASQANQIGGRGIKMQAMSQTGGSIKLTPQRIALKSWNGTGQSKKLKISSRKGENV